jgi:hypothetical protein
VQLDHGRRPPHRAPRREGRLWSDRPARQQHGNPAAGLRLAAHLPARPQAGRRARRRLRAITLGNINELLRELTRLYGNKHLWITEYGYQTNPPDRSFGVSWTKQATYLSQAYAVARANPRIDMMIWFLVKDEARIGNGWQSGFYTANGRRKPSWQAFRRMPK